MSSEPNYRSLAKRAFEACGDYVASLEDQYASRREYRAKEKIPVLAFCGHGRHGKDQSAEFLAAFSDVKYGGSVSWYVLPLVAHAMEMPVDVCWRTRHDNRNFWREFCDALRWDDPAILVRMVLSDSDVVAGIRAKAELWTAWGEGHIDQLVWVDRPGFPKDPTLQYEFSDLTHLPSGTRNVRGLSHIDNQFGLEYLAKRVKQTAKQVGVSLVKEEGNG